MFQLGPVQTGRLRNHAAFDIRDRGFQTAESVICPALAIFENGICAPDGRNSTFDTRKPLDELFERTRRHMRRNISPFAIPVGRLFACTVDQVLPGRV